MRSQPHSDELRTFRGETEQRRHCKKGGTICAVAECHCRHDMMMNIITVMLHLGPTTRPLWTHLGPSLPQLLLCAAAGLL